MKPFTEKLQVPNEAFQIVHVIPSTKGVSDSSILEKLVSTFIGETDADAENILFFEDLILPNGDVHKEKRSRCAKHIVFLLF